MSRKIKINGTDRTVYTHEDSSFLTYMRERCERQWYKSWIEAGKPEEGTCVINNGFMIWYLDKGKRKPRPVFIAKCNFTQGNIGAYKTSDSTHCELQRSFDDFWYDDGNMN